MLLPLSAVRRAAAILIIGVVLVVTLAAVPRDVGAEGSRGHRVQ